MMICCIGWHGWGNWLILELLRLKCRFFRSGLLVRHDDDMLYIVPLSPTVLSSTSGIIVPDSNSRSIIRSGRGFVLSFAVQLRKQQLEVDAGISHLLSLSVSCTLRGWFFRTRSSPSQSHPSRARRASLPLPSPRQRSWRPASLSQPTQARAQCPDSARLRPDRL